MAIGCFVGHAVESRIAIPVIGTPQRLLRTGVFVGIDSHRIVASGRYQVTMLSDYGFRIPAIFPPRIRSF